MADPKDVVASAITRAQTDLAQALSEIEKISGFGSDALAYTTHALNNYLSVTRAAVDLIARRLADHPDPQIAVWLESVSRATETMANLVNQLTSTSLTTELRLHFERVDLVPSLQRLADFSQRLASRKSIPLILDSSDAVPPVWTDRIAMLSVLDNLVSNAIKYSPPGKPVRLRVRNESRGVVCEVRDEGPGLNREDQARLFQRGVLLTPRPTAGETSTGYGLAVAKDLVAKLGGEIWCESELGQGTAFFVRLPVCDETVSASESLTMHT